MNTYTIRRLLVWTRRLKYCRGFGVQSPWAYSFIRYVVNEHYPYYAYESLAKKYESEHPKRRKVARLYFRMANHIQSLKVIDFNAPSAIYADYITSGCKKSEVINIANNFSDDDIARIAGAMHEARLVRISMTGRYKEFYQAIRQYIEPKTFVIFEGIKQSHDTKAYWNIFAEKTASVTTFDLYYCGILYKDHSRYKQNYIVNF